MPQIPEDEQPTTPAGLILKERFERLPAFGPNEWGYPDAACFLPSDVEHAGEALIWYAETRRPAVLGFPNGDEVIILHFETRRDTPPPFSFRSPFSDDELAEFAQVQREQHDRWLRAIAARRWQPEAEK